MTCMGVDVEGRSDCYIRWITFSFEINGSGWVIGHEIQMK